MRYTVGVWIGTKVCCTLGTGRPKPNVRREHRSMHRMPHERCRRKCTSPNKPAHICPRACRLLPQRRHVRSILTADKRMQGVIKVSTQTQISQRPSPPRKLLHLFLERPRSFRKVVPGQSNADRGTPRIISTSMCYMSLNPYGARLVFNIYCAYVWD